LGVEVLLIDDEELIHSSAKAFLDNNGDLNLVTAGSAQEALEQLRDSDFDIVVCDHQMPGMTGLELLEVLRNSGNEIPFIMFTGHSREEVVIRALNLGADSYIKKGGDPEAQYAELLHMIESIIGNRRKLEESEEKYRKLFSNLLVGFAHHRIIYDDESNPCDYVYLDINKTFEDMTGLKRADIIGRRVTEIMPGIENDQQDWIGTYGRVVTTGQEIRFDSYAEPLEHWYSIHAYKSDVDQFVTVFVDITERKRAEDLLRYQACLLDNVTDAVISTDFEFRITTWNTAAERLYGWRSEEVLGASLMEVTKWTYADDISSDEVRNEFTESGSWSGEVVQARKDGSQIIVRASFSLVKDETGAPIGAVSVNRDVTEQRAAEEAVRESEARFRHFFLNAPVYCFMVSPEGTLLDANTAALEALGYTPHEIVGEPVAMLYSPESQEKAKQLFEKWKESGAIADEVMVVKTKSGESRTVLLSAQAVRDGTGEITHSISIQVDITVRRMAEKALAASEAKFRTIFEGSGIGVALVEPESQQILDANPALSRMLGYSREELVEMKVQDISVTEDFLTDLNLWRETRAADKTWFQLEKRYIKKNGEIMWGRLTSSSLVDSEGIERYIVGMVEDIDDRKKAEEAMLLSEERYRILFERAGDAIFIHGYEGNFIDVNEVACARLGYTREQLLEISPAHIDSQEHVERIPELLSAIQERGDIVFESAHVTSFGEAIPVEISSTVIDYEGAPAVLSIARDISERKSAERILLSQKKELSEFAHLLAHDLRGLIFVLRSYIQIQQHDPERRLSDDLEAVLQRMTTLIDNSVALADAGLIIGDKSEVCMNEVVGVVARTLVPPEIEVVIGSLPSAVLDRGKMEQVFLNLLRNAVEHGKPKQIEILTEVGESFASILVRNDGHPIPPVVRNRLFNGKISSKNGGGIGLRIVSRIIAAHGWNISLDESGITCFRIDIPLEDICSLDNSQTPGKCFCA
jgi:PAS domain S-box-containing protein